MLVQENNLLNDRDTLSVVVVWAEGHADLDPSPDKPPPKVDSNREKSSSAGWVWEAFVPLDMPVNKLKQMALAHFLEKTEAAKIENQYRLLLPELGRRMVENRTLGDEVKREGAESPTEIILMKTNQSKVPAPELGAKEIDGPAPTQQDIEKATGGVPMANLDRASNAPYSVIDMQVQLRRIFLTLLEIACKLQADNPVVSNLLQQTLERLRKKIKEFPEVEKDKLKQLVNMGFSVPRCVRALRMFRHNLRQATDWLIAHPMSVERSVEEVTQQMTRGGIRLEYSSSPNNNVGTEARDRATPADQRPPRQSTDAGVQTTRGGIRIEYSTSPDDNVGTEVRQQTTAPAAENQSSPSNRPVTEEISVQTLDAPVAPGDYLFSPLTGQTPEATTPTQVPTPATSSPPPEAAPDAEPTNAQSPSANVVHDPLADEIEEDPLAATAAYSMAAMPTNKVSNTKQGSAKAWDVLFREVSEALKEFHKLHFIPHHGMMEGLIEMGFTEEDSEVALQVTGNKRGPACEWLLAGNKGPATEYESGFPRDCPVIATMFQHTAVQMGLMRPKTVAALLNMLEVPMAAQHWLHDPELNAFLTTVFRIFHAERHNLDRAPLRNTTSAIRSSTMSTGIISRGI